MSTLWLHRVVIAVVGITLAATIYSYWLLPEWLDRLTQEDGVIEYATAVAYLVAAAAMFLATARHRWRKLWCILIGVVFAGIAGEEISWGQRLLGVDTPDELRQINVQGELNLHNIEGVHENVRLVGLVALAILYIGLPLSVALSRHAAALLGRLKFPLPRPIKATVISAGVGMALMAAPRLGGGEYFPLDEMGELCLSLAAVGFGISTASHRPVP
jgi:hypothetical protein